MGLPNVVVGVAMLLNKKRKRGKEKTGYDSEKNHVYIFVVEVKIITEISKEGRVNVDFTTPGCEKAVHTVLFTLDA